MDRVMSFVSIENGLMLCFKQSSLINSISWGVTRVCSKENEESLASLELFSDDGILRRS